MSTHAPILSRALEKAAMPQHNQRIESAGTIERIWIMLIIFVVSLFAVSFPTISSRIRFLRIPGIVFFVGKHFGTGVILSTAFVHLLQDAFQSLQNPIVRERWKIGDWAGLLILGSLMTIFVIEYVSTSFVDRLQSYSSAPSSPTASLASVPSSPITSPLDLIPEPSLSRPSNVVSIGTHSRVGSRPSHDNVRTASSFAHKEDSGHAAGAPLPFAPPESVEEISQADRLPEPYEETPFNVLDQSSSSRHKYYGATHTHIRPPPRDIQSPYSLVGTIDTNRVPHTLATTGEYRVGGIGLGLEEPEMWRLRWMDTDTRTHTHIRKVMRIHIMSTSMHTLTRIWTWSASLVAAIIFHQLFEGLSLGIRIAGLPSSSSQDGFKRLPGRVLKPLLAFMFAVTTPVGIAAGLGAFGSGHNEGAKLLLIEGVMSAVSAGMLIYAACVEMLAGDFVMDPHLWRSSVRRQVLALVSLFLGVAAMAAVGT
ncbi:Zinc transporter 5 [Grifola frondosa]|uniref:Zinc transporter 5 n=1 Tax=Grifola frondosa TaxID=5627 RepID=A0A1C7M8A4_GRIFR|nr:Zinc transporter 5 [Grifola frondosa]